MTSNADFYLFLDSYILHRPIGPLGRMFAVGPGDQSSLPV